MTGHLLNCMPSGGVVYLYRGLAGTASGINPLDLIYRKKQLKGFLLTPWLYKGGVRRMTPRMLSASGIISAGLQDQFTRVKTRIVTMMRKITKTHKVQSAKVVVNVLPLLALSYIIKELILQVLHKE